MTKYSYAERVAKKVRQLYQHDERFKDILSRNPLVMLDEKFCLLNLNWQYYNTNFIVCRERIFVYQGSTQTTLLTYSSFDELLGMK